MNLLKKTVGFMAVFCVIPAAIALTARPSVVTTVSTRLPSMAAYLNAVTNGTAATTGTTTANLLDNAECIDAYTDCLSQSDVCGSDFEECTTSVLFHAQMPKCLSVLGQCSASGVNALFGTSSTTALSTVKSTNEYDEVTEYTYPTAGSVLGQMIDGARIANMYDTSNCVRRYTTCLQASNVCGADFELCTTDREFKKQRVYCDSVLARCQSDGKIELFGSTNINASPIGGRIGEMIADGEALAAVNAVSTCYRVADQCILNACAQNPYKCIAGSSRTVAMLADAIKSADPVLSDEQLRNTYDTLTNSEIEGYIKTACFDTIGANQYCFMTANGDVPSQADLSDPIEQELVFTNIFQSRWNESMRSQLDTIMQDFDQQAKSDCSDTISECVMRTCGGGSGPACYALVFRGDGEDTINKESVYGDLKSGCAAIVNTDANCKYAAANTDSVGGYVYTYNSEGAFDKLFPEYNSSSSSDDPIGVIAWLNASLSTSYNTAALNQMKVNCENAAKSCIKTMCGNEYTNCYRNRTDMASTLTNTGNSAFDDSMNRVGGVLDYTIVLGLCMDSVKNASACEEYLDVEAAKNMDAAEAETAQWGASSARVHSNWLDAGTYNSGMTQLTDDAGNYVCRADDGSRGPCNQMNNETHQYYDEPVYVSLDEAARDTAAKSVFTNLLFDIEKEAQAIYNAKLTQEQNMCMASNSGGIMGAGGMESTFVWAKLNNNRVPDNYTMDGLKSSQFKASNELYGSFCAVRVTLQSDDATVQNALRGKEWATTYFATGDTFACGSWIPQGQLNQLADAAFADKTENQKTLRTWLGVLGGLGGAVGGAYLGAGIADGSVFGKLTGLQKQDTKTTFNATTVQNTITNYLQGSIEASEKITDDYDDINQLEEWISNVDAGWKMVKDQLRNVANIDKQIVNLADGAVDDWTKAVKEQQKWLENQETCDAMEEGKRERKKSCDEERPDVQTLIDAAADAETQLGKLYTAVDNIDGEVKENRITRTQVGSIIGGVVGAGATATIVALAARDIQDAQLDAEQQAWLDEMGSRLKCYVGTTEAGQYGDIISITLEQ